MSTPHFIFDFETIGQSIFKAPIVNCAYTIFDWERFTSDKPYTFDELVDQIKFDKLDVEFQVREQGCVIKQSDLKWWMDQGPLAFKQIRPSINDLQPDDFITNLITYIGAAKLNRWWSRSNCFDPVLLQRAVEASSKYSMKDINKILPFWQLRDTRTFIDTRFNFTLKYNTFCPYEDQAEWDKVFVKHYSPHDVAADILRMQKIEQIIKG